VTQVARILDLLPQTQCKRCGYPDCEAYAQAIAQGQADINQCPPGGAEGIHRLAGVTGLPAKPLNPEFGVEAPRHLVWIDEDWCIGCTLCMDACPVDAIIGTHKNMHTVIEQECTGCELCLPACPVDCIMIENASDSATGWSAWSAQAADNARQRYAARQQRLSKNTNEATDLEQPTIQSRIQAALARAKAQLGHNEE
jgi:electron transport complex protein RnfB